MHLWINLTDLAMLGTIGPSGSPLNLMIRKDLGDALLPGAITLTSGWMTCLSPYLLHQSAAKPSKTP